MGWDIAHWSLWVGALILIPLAVMACSLWVIQRTWRTTKDQSSTSIAVACCTLIAAISIPVVYGWFGFHIARHCTRPGYILAVFGGTLLVHALCYFMVVRRGLMDAIVGVAAKLFRRQWNSSWQLHVLLLAVLVFVDAGVFAVDALYRTAAAMGLSIGAVAMLILGGFAWLWQQSNDGDNGGGGGGGYSSPSSPIPSGPRNATIIGDGNTVYQGNFHGRDFHFR